MLIDVSFQFSDPVLTESIRNKLPGVMNVAVCHPGGVILVEVEELGAKRTRGVFIHRVLVEASNPKVAILLVDLVPPEKEAQLWKST